MLQNPEIDMYILTPYSTRAATSRFSFSDQLNISSFLERDSWSTKKTFQDITRNVSVCYYHDTYEMQSESTLYSFPECQGTTCLK